MVCKNRAGRYTGLTSVAGLDVPSDMADAWAEGCALSHVHPDPEIGHHYWRRWSDVDLEIFLLTLCETPMTAKILPFPNATAAAHLPPSNWIDQINHMDKPTPPDERPPLINPETGLPPMPYQDVPKRPAHVRLAFYVVLLATAIYAVLFWGGAINAVDGVFNLLLTFLT